MFFCDMKSPKRLQLNAIFPTHRLIFCQNNGNPILLGQRDQWYSQSIKNALLNETSRHQQITKSAHNIFCCVNNFTEYLLFQPFYLWRSRFNNMELIERNGHISYVLNGSDDSCSKYLMVITLTLIPMISRKKWILSIVTKSESIKHSYLANNILFY